MSNDFSGNPIVLDTFTSAIDLKSDIGSNTARTVGSRLNVAAIEWMRPTTIGHTADIYDGTRPIFNHTCATANQGIKDYTIGWLDNVNIAISGVQSGSIKIFLA